MKKKTKVRLAVLGVLVLAAAIFVSGVFNPNYYVLVCNESEGDIYQVRLDFSFSGKMSDTDGMSSIARRSGVVGDNSYYPIEPGERIPMHMYPREGRKVGDTAVITLAVDNVRIKPADSIGWGVEIPIRRGACTELIIRGSSEAGYTLVVGGFANWLISWVGVIL